MGLAQVVTDSLKNLVSSLGTSKDKSVANSFYVNLLNPEQLLNAYRGDWVAGKIVDIPAEDATREWRVWQAEKDQISALEAEETRLNVKGKTREALVGARLFGGGAIYMGLPNNGKPEEPLDLERIKKGDLKYLHVLDKTEISAQTMNWDLESPWYGEPTMYTVNSDNTGSLQVHPSRVVRFIGRKYPTRALQSTDGWGDSVLQRLNDAVKQASLASEGIATLINEASVDVIKIPDFMNSIGTAEYRARIVERFQLALVGKSMNNSLILDKEEDYEKKQVNFSGLPDVIRVYLIIASGAGDIPATRLVGQSPQGLNATGDSDLRNYYDNVGAQQRNFIQPVLSRLDEVLIRSALGNRPDEIFYKWLPLWQMTQNEQADVFLKKSQAIANIYNTGYVPDEAMSKGVQNMLIEDGTFPGLESALEELPEDSELDEDDDEVKAQFSNDPEEESELETEPNAE